MVYTHLKSTHYNFKLFRWKNNTTSRIGVKLVLSLKMIIVWTIALKISLQSQVKLLGVNKN